MCDKDKDIGKVMEKVACRLFFIRRIGEELFNLFNYVPMDTT